MTVQPGEFAKLVIILYLAAWADRKRNAMDDFYFGVLPTLVIIVLFAGFILWQPDLGTMIVLIVTSMVMLFVGGINLRYFFWTIVAGLLSLIAFIKFEPYRARRITTFLNPAIDPKGISYQINQALLTIGSGGLWGYGYGLSRQKYNYLPESTTDSIFAIMAEELGFVRVSVLMLLFAVFILRGIMIAKSAPDQFGKMIAVGIVSFIGFQAVINVGAMVGLLPLTGIPLPFFSYGSTALTVTMAGVGVLLNISKQANLKQ
jgi:cell division protein FtsW